MLKVLQVAAYIMSRYYTANNIKMDEMKLHKLLYFAQRESYIQNDRPLFNERFEAWQYGPVMVCVREAYASDNFGEVPSDDVLKPYMKTFDSVFEFYANRSSWTLSMLSHAETSWQKARNGYSDNATNCHVQIDNNDIREDANIIKYRRIKLNSVSSTL